MEDDRVLELRITRRQLEMLRQLIQMAWQSGAAKSREAGTELIALEAALENARPWEQPGPG